MTFWAKIADTTSRAGVGVATDSIFVLRRRAPSDSGEHKAKCASTLQPEPLLEPRSLDPEQQIRSWQRQSGPSPMRMIFVCQRRLSRVVFPPDRRWSTLGG